MPITTYDIRQTLLETDVEFRCLAEEHSRCEMQLKQLLTEPYVNSQEFTLMERGNQNWLYNCEYVMEVPKPKNDVPHFLADKNPFIRDFQTSSGFRSMPCSPAPKQRIRNT